MTTQMTFLILSLMLAFQASALNINGYVVVDQDQHLLIDRETARTFRIQPSNPEVKKSLMQLATFDSLRGQVSSKEGDTLLLEAIDFVSLRRLLGEWRDDHSRVSFEDYSRVKMETDGTERHFLYALSPGPNNDWRIYLTDQASVVLGSLLVNDNQAFLEFYDPQTGHVSQNLQLSKVPAR